MQQDEATVERENNEIIGALGNDMTRLKQAAAELRDQVKEDNTFLDILAGRFNAAATGVRTQTGRLDSVMKQYGCKHTMMIGGAICLVLVLLYYLIVAMSSKKPETS